MKKYVLMLACVLLIPNISLAEEGFFSKFISNIHGKSICKKIMEEFNKSQNAIYFDPNNNIVTGGHYKGGEKLNAFDSEYKHTEKDKNIKYSQDKDICKIWIKGFSSRPYAIINGLFYLTDKHNAEIKYTNTYIKEKITSLDTISLSFDFYSDSFKDAENVVFSYNNNHIPMKDQEYCLEQDRLYKEAVETYNYEYNDFLSCNCNPPSDFVYLSDKNDSKCKIFSNDKIKENCILLSMLVPNCNKWIKERNIENGFTDLMSAVSNERRTLDDIIALITNGADVNARDKNGLTVLMYATSENKNPEIIKELIRAGANINAKDNLGNTALMYAAKNNTNTEIIKELIRAGANIKDKNNDGAIALVFALDNKNRDIIKALVEKDDNIVRNGKKGDSDEIKNEKQFNSQNMEYSNRLNASEITNISKFINQGCLSEKDFISFILSSNIYTKNKSIYDLVSSLIWKYKAKQYSCPEIQKNEILIAVNFSNVSDEDFSSASDNYKYKFWYGNNEILSIKYKNGQLDGDELYELCTSITNSNASYRICKAIYYKHHGAPEGSGVVLDANNLTKEQLEEIAFELCGKETCANEEEIKKHNEGIGSSGFCGSSGCNIGEFDFFFVDEYYKMLELIKNKK